MYATLFDFDGVLVDSEPVHLAAFNDVLAGRGIVIDDKEYAEHYLSLDDASVFRAVLARGRATLDEELIRALVVAKAPRFMERFEASFRVFPGARELLVRRAARGPIAIVSGALEREVELGLEKMGVRDKVAFIVAADHTTASKPDPAPYLAALASLARARHAGLVVAIEDSLGGIASARAANVRCVGVAHAYTAEQLTSAGAAAVASCLGELSDALLEDL